MKAGFIVIGTVLIAWAAFDLAGDAGLLGTDNPVQKVYDQIPRPPVIGDWGGLIGGAIAVWWGMR